MAVPYRREKEVRLREMFSSDYKLITILPAWSLWNRHDRIGQELDDVLFARLKDILVDPERYLSTLNSWFIAHKEEFTRVYDALMTEYDPLSNYSMIEQEGEVSKEGIRHSSSKRYGVDRVTNTLPEGRSDRYTSTFDSDQEGRLDSYTVDSIINAPVVEGQKVQISESEQVEDISGKKGSEITEQYIGDVTVLAPERAMTGDHGSERELTREGNVGVTTSQQMLESELELRAKYSFINFFCDLFSREMTIGVWDI